MYSVIQRYYRVNKTFMSQIGIWPNQSRLARILIPMAMAFIDVSYVATELCNFIFFILYSILYYSLAVSDTVEQLQRIDNQLKNKCVAAEMVYTKYYHFILTIRNILLKFKRKVMLTFFIREKQMFIILIFLDHKLILIKLFYIFRQDNCFLGGKDHHDFIIITFIYRFYRVYFCILIIYIFYYLNGYSIKYICIVNDGGESKPPTPPPLLFFLLLSVQKSTRSKYSCSYSPKCYDARSRETARFTLTLDRRWRCLDVEDCSIMLRYGNTFRTKVSYFSTLRTTARHDYYDIC
ncbi:Odorant receptor 405 [Nylanderia fulva]|uniref:Odorant receptor 405 n=1 Tax=Nylanderia fulva TaxID=613905 RepID=A0A6G1LPY4_9HYME|nr:Odorant receptor 405 [Nylanderia fulva]